MTWLLRFMYPNYIFRLLKSTIMCSTSPNKYEYIYTWFPQTKSKAPRQIYKALHSLTPTILCVSSSALFSLSAFSLADFFLHNPQITAFYLPSFSYTVSLPHSFVSDLFVFVYIISPLVTEIIVSLTSLSLSNQAIISLGVGHELCFKFQINTCWMNA